MSCWQVQIPHRSRRDSLVDVAALARHVPGQDEDRNALRQLVIQAQVDGVATSAGELIDHLESLEPTQRRLLLDRARKDCGLPTTREVDERRQFDTANAAAREIASRESPYQTCHGPHCRVAPVNAEGALVPVHVKRWFCAEHRHLAAPGDMEPRPSRLRIMPGGAIVEAEPVEQSRQRATELSLQHQSEARLIEARAQAEARRRDEEAIRKQICRELPAQMRGLIP